MELSPMYSSWRLGMIIPVCVVACCIPTSCGDDPVAVRDHFEEARTAISGRDVESLAKVIKERPELVAEIDKNGETLLHILAVFSYSSETSPDAYGRMADCLIDAGSDLNAVNKMGNTPLLEAAMARSVIVGSALLKAGADCRVARRRPGQDKLPKESQHPEDGECAIDIAAMRGCDALVEQLLQLDVPVEYPKTRRRQDSPPFKDSSLHFACRNCVHSESTEAEKKNACRTVDLLCAKISDVNVKNIDGRTPLHVAAEWGSEVIVDHLLTNHPLVDINARDAEGNTAIHLAVDDRASDSVSLDVQLTSEHSEAVVKVLLRYGAQINVENNHGDTPLSCARRKRSKALIDILQAK